MLNKYKKGIVPLEILKIRNQFCRSLILFHGTFWLHSSLAVRFFAGVPGKLSPEKNKASYILICSAVSNVFPLLKHSKLLVFHCVLGYFCLNQDENEMLYIFRFNQMINSS